MYTYEYRRPNHRHYHLHNFEVLLPDGVIRLPVNPHMVNWPRQSMIHTLEFASKKTDLYLGFPSISLICALVLQIDLCLGFAN